jgi:hypothetical protein
MAEMLSNIFDSLGLLRHDTNYNEPCDDARSLDYRTAGQARWSHCKTVVASLGTPPSLDSGYRRVGGRWRNCVRHVRRTVYRKRLILMGSLKPPKSLASHQRSTSYGGLLHLMSEVVSLRERVAQAELAAHLYGGTIGEGTDRAPSD